MLEIIKNRYIVFISIYTLLAICIISCNKTDYTIQAFTFPKGSKIHKNDWAYMTKIKVSSKHTPITDKSNKIVEITIYDNLENNLFERRFSFFCASIKATAEWENFDSLNVNLQEVGNKYAKDNYNKKLIINGPLTLIQLSLKYDGINKVFSEGL